MQRFGDAMDFHSLHKEGIRCESGAVPATVSPVNKEKHSYATVLWFLNGKVRFFGVKSGNLPSYSDKFSLGKKRTVYRLIP